MIAIDDLRSCENCGNVFLKKTGGTRSQTDALHAMCGRRKSSLNEVKHVFLSQEITA
ncbi:MAG: hypothetical protein OEW49_06635 [Nitrosopumilus sp.]|nr:hypothetical protein [Nitrosopumilus sp.]